MGATPPQTAMSPPPNGGIGVIRDSTRRRHAEGRLLMLQNPHRHWHGGGRETWPRCRRDRRAWLRCPWAAGPDTSQHADRSSRRGRPKRAAPTPPPAKFRMQFPRSTNRRKLKNRRISTIRTQIPTCAHGNCMRNCWLTAIAGHQGNASTRRSTSAAKAPLVWRAPERSEGRAAGHAGRGTRGRRGRTTCQRADRSSRRGRPKRAAPTPPPAKFRT